MRKFLSLLFTLLLLAPLSAAQAAIGDINTVAGTDRVTWHDDSTPLSINDPQALISEANDIAVAPNGDRYIADTFNHRIRKVVTDTNGTTITTIAGNGVAGFSGDNGLAINAQLNHPRGIAFDSAGNIYIADTSNNRIRVINKDSTDNIIDDTINTYLGQGGEKQLAIPPGQNSNLSIPTGIAIDSNNNLYFSDSDNHRVFRLQPTDNAAWVFAGTGIAGMGEENVTADASALYHPTYLTIDESTGNTRLYISDRENHRIRIVDEDNNITTVAGNGAAGFSDDANALNAQFNKPEGLVYQPGVGLYIADINNHRIRLLAGGAVTTIAGTGDQGFSGDGGEATSADLNGPIGMAIDTNGDLLVTDSGNFRIRRMDLASSPTNVSTNVGHSPIFFAGDGGQATDAQLYFPYDMTSDTDGSLYIADTRNNRIRKVAPDPDGTITTIAGDGSITIFNGPAGITTDNSGNLYISDTGNHRILKIDLNNNNDISPIFEPNDIAILNTPIGLTIGPNGDLYVADRDNHRIIRIEVNNGNTDSVFAGAGAPPPLNASLNSPTDVAFDSDGNLYIADNGNHRIRKITINNNTISTYAGNGLQGYSGDGELATAAQLHSPIGITFDINGHLLISDEGNNRIRRVTPDGIISRLAGNGENRSSGDSAPALNAGLSTYGITTNTDGTLLYIADNLNSRIRVVELNTVPTASNNTITIDEDTPYTFGKTELGINEFGTIDSDGQVLQVRIETLPTNGTLSYFNNDEPLHQSIPIGALAFLVYKPAQDGFGNSYDSFQFRAFDSFDFSYPVNTVTFDVTAVNDDPPTAQDNTITMDEDTTYSFTADDFGYADPDDISPQDSFTSVTITSIPPDTDGTLWLSTNGNVITDDNTVDTNDVIDIGIIPDLRYTPVAHDFGNGQATFNFTVSDGENNSIATNTITFNVSNANNDAPFLSGTPSLTVDEDNFYDFSPASFGDPDLPEEVLTFSIQGSLPWATLDPSTGRLSGTPGNEHVGNYTGIRIIISDDEGGEDDIGPFDITVNPVNDAPVFTSPPITTALEDSLYSFIPTVSDVDNSANELVISNNGALPDWLEFIPATDVLPAKLTGTPENSEVGTYNNISLKVKDNGTNGDDTNDDVDARTTLLNFSITVLNTNDAPTGSVTISYIGSPNAPKENQTLTATSTLNDDDGIGTLHYTWKRDGVPVGSDSSTYLLDDDDVGALMGVDVSYTDGRGTFESAANTPELSVVLTDPVTNEDDQPTGQVTIIGLPLIGSTLDATNNIFDADGFNTADFDYEWKRIKPDGSEQIVGTDSSYIPTDNSSTDPDDTDIGNRISVTISYQDLAQNPHSLTSVPTAVIDKDSDLDGIGDSTDPDKDGDGMDNDYEDTYSCLDPLIPDATINFDGDTYGSNIVEHDNGTNPCVAPPVFDNLSLDTIDVNSEGLLTEVGLGIVTADNESIIATADDYGPFLPGSRIITWTATNSGGESATTEQVLNVTPMVEFSIDQVANKGSTATVTAHLNGNAPVYPVTVPFTISTDSSADANDYTNVTPATSISISSGVTGNFTIDILDDGTNEGDETITFEMGTLTNAVAGTKLRHTIRISDEHIPQRVSLQATQGSANTTALIIANSTPVVITALPSDGSLYEYDWSSSHNALVDDSNADIHPYTFIISDPTTLASGIYHVDVNVTEIGTTPPVVNSAKLLLRVTLSPPLLSDDDSDKDGIDDNVEGFSDSDGDGIANYRDAISVKHVMATRSNFQTTHLIETQPGLHLKLGQVAFTASSIEPLVSAENIFDYSKVRTRTDDHINVGGLFDFEIHNLPEPGATARVVLPQHRAIPATPHYRKLLEAGGWQDFTINDNNQLSSAAGAEGNCPPPGDAAYTSGLTTGHWCVQLLIADGGPNDADGKANGVIVDPGGVSSEPEAAEAPQQDTSGANRSAAPTLDGGSTHLITLLLLLLALGWRYHSSTHARSNLDQ